MAFLKVDLSSVSSVVREAMKDFAYYELEAGSDVIIIRATQAELTTKFAELTLAAAEQDITLTFPQTMQELKWDTVINGKTVYDIFDHAGPGVHLMNGDVYQGGIWYIK